MIYFALALWGAAVAAVGALAYVWYTHTDTPGDYIDRTLLGD